MVSRLQSILWPDSGRSRLAGARLMSGPVIDTQRALDDAIPATLQVRRERHLRSLRSQRLRVGVVLGLSAVLAFFSVAAILVAKEMQAAAATGFMAVLTYTFAFYALRSGQMRIASELRSLDRTDRSL